MALLRQGFLFYVKSTLNCILVLKNALYMLLYSCKVIKEIKGDNQNGNQTNHERIQVDTGTSLQGL